ncbi:MAG TPA: chromosome segregation protein SMC [Gemmataceae bacterium]|nr:chromosome segregation protein SMC [Gemmataceae bacterium]
MLKRLELVGFKSFADKTQFDFPWGITAIVGPNGSGKSNVVDAVRWILGEQSAKSLRGGEMADVIFNGSTSRRSLGLAEVTMTFDNNRRILTTEADEVQITRRVYRDGEGEYLINQQICRLRDIRELFLGSGAGTDAYCIIEQGRVDVLLQASTRDRRVIFEEAAGISRFKAKKIETLRKLERVDLNLQRLRDIIEEVEKQLRSVKLQASKAQRFQEYTQRLKELRVALGMEEYHQLCERLQAETIFLDNLKAGLKERADQADSWEAEYARLEERLTGLDETVREQEGLLAGARQQIAAEETTLGHEWSLSAELETDLAETRSRMTELNTRVSDLATTAALAAEELHAVETQGLDQWHVVQSLDETLQAAISRLAELKNQVQADQGNHLEFMRQAARLHNDAVSFQARLETLCRERDRLFHKTEQASGHLASLDLELDNLSKVDEGLQSRLAASRQALLEQKLERERLRQLHDDTGKTISDLRAQRSGLASRNEVLEGLEKSHEGLGTGVRELITLLSEETEKKQQEIASAPRSPGTELPIPANKPFTLSQVVLGMVADFLTVRREYAPLIDLVLGDRAQRFLVSDVDRLAEILNNRPQPLSGRVSFLPLANSDWKETKTSVNNLPPYPFIDIAPAVGEGSESVPQEIRNHPGMVARAEDVVSCAKPGLELLPSQLLGRTWIVRDLHAARDLASSTGGYRFVTLNGELLEPDGTLTVGTHHAETGILSRKSELREIRLQIEELDNRIGETQQAMLTLRDRTGTLDSRLGSLQEEINILAEQSADLRSRMEQRRQRREGLHEEVALSRNEILGVEQDIQGLEESWQGAKFQAEETDRQVHDLQIRLEDADREIREQDQCRQQSQQEVTTAKVAMAKIEERVTGLRAKHLQIQTDLAERRQERLQGEHHLAGAQARLEESQLTMLRASSALAQWYLQKENAEHRITALTGERDRVRQERHSLAEKAQTVRNEWRAHQEQAHARELVVNDMRHHRDGIADRLREDYQIELADLYRQAMNEGRFGPAEALEDSDLELEEGVPEEEENVLPKGKKLDSAVTNEEIAELRRKLSRLGSVNLDALQELTDLERRADTLQTQFGDLTAAKRSLEEIIATINQDSRRLFTETFASIRTHFQELFRKLFGGGMADIVLEDDSDILESGIEIIARPPGKELRSISLMSGGEKTLTAVALLLAIFRSKPSPFCILDEVDAALDEANIGRFTAVLREFLDQSQFILITHSKKTMAVADVLYGITMQESGVSKRVAVRFEDWEENPQPANGEPVAATRN